MQGVKRFGRDQRGATAVVFGLSLLPFMAAVGSAVDYSRAGLVKSDLQRAVDATVLGLVALPAGASQADLDRKASQFFAATFKGESTTTLRPLAATRPTPNTVRVTATGDMRTAMMGLFGFPTMEVGATAASTFGTGVGGGPGTGGPGTKIELALVLDSTGSMADRIGGRVKMDALRASATDLLTQLRPLATEPDQIKVSVVPFDTEVRLDAGAHRNKYWLRWTNEATDKPAWTGYVHDRHGDYATSDAPPAASVAASLYPAPRASEYKSDPALSRLSTGDLPAIRPLTPIRAQAGYDAAVGVINAMRPRGYTNIALGVNWGMATLSESEPFTEARPRGTPDVKKYMVVLTDGKNTMNHVNGELKADVARIDDNTRRACASAKATGVEVFTIRLLEGDANLLRNCASSPTMYFDVQNAAQLTDAFQTILTAIGGTRITH